jgi:hypothetical protein
MKYRLYIDEVGNPDLKSSTDPNHRYLSLTGVVLELGYVDRTVFPMVEALKRRYFKSHPDEPVVLHRKELVNRRPPFEALRNPETGLAFDHDLSEFLLALECAVVTVTLDKLRHREMYQVWRFDPYHHCLAALVERYVLWLERRAATGDVMAEARGGREDRRLKQSFAEVHAAGSPFVSPEKFSRFLTSRQLKLRPKVANIAGLQIADLLAHPCCKAAVARRHGDCLPGTFGGKIAQMLEEQKYDRGPDGEIDGWGRIWLP